MQSARGRHVEKVQKQQLLEEHAHVLALSKAQPISYYDMDGMILDVNENFEAMVGYSRAELLGKHVSIFVDESTRRSQETRHRSRGFGRNCAWERTAVEKGNASRSRGKSFGWNIPTILYLTSTVRLTKS